MTGSWEEFAGPFFEALHRCKDSPHYCGNAIHYSLMEMVFILRASAHLKQHTVNSKQEPLLLAFFF